MDLKEKFIGNAITIMSQKLNSDSLSELRNCLITLFEDFDLVPHKELPSLDIIDNTYVIKHFLATKKMSGLSDNTLKTYLYHTNKFLDSCQKNVQDINTNHIRRYLGQLGINRSNSYVDDARRILNSFFTFCENEEYVTKNPCKRIERIKQKKIMETPYSDTEIELLREACKTPREIALVDFLLSTGCRRDEIRKITLSNSSLKIIQLFKIRYITFTKCLCLVSMQKKERKILMEKIHFYNTNTIYEGITDFINKHVLVINFKDAIPYTSEINNGFELLNENNDYVQAEYQNFTTIYRTYEDDPYRIELSDDESVYVEPEPVPDPESYVPTLEEIKFQKINELSYICSQSITNGVDIKIDDVMEHFSYKDEDQVNIKEIFDLAVQTNVPMYYHSDGNSCKLYTVEQIISLYTATTTNKMHHQTYFNQLKLYILSLEDSEFVKGINYGDTLTGNYLVTYNDAMAQAKTLIETLLSTKNEA